MTEAHKLGRVQVIQTAFNCKNVAYLCKGYVIKQSHNYTGRHIEKAVFTNGDVIVYDENNKEIAKQAGKKPAKQSKAKAKSINTQKLPDATDEKLG